MDIQNYINKEFGLGSIVVQEEEVADVMFATIEDIEQLFNEGVFKKGHYMMFKDCLNYLENNKI